MIKDISKEPPSGAVGSQELTTEEANTLTPGTCGGTGEGRDVQSVSVPVLSPPPAVTAQLVTLGILRTSWRTVLLPDLESIPRPPHPA